MSAETITDWRLRAERDTNSNCA